MPSNHRPAFVPSVLWAAALTLGPDPAAAQLLSPSDLMAAEAPAPDDVIAWGEGPLQFGRLHLPQGAGPHPLLVFIHGGCWLSYYDIQHVAATEQGFADAGWAVWSLEYRRVGDDGGGWPGTFLDIADGVDFVRTLNGRSLKNGRTVRLDPDRIVVAGHSAGAALALWVAARPRLSPDSELYRADPLPVEGVLALAPATTLAAYHEAEVCGGVMDGLMGGGPAQVSGRYDQVSPMRIMPQGVPQELVVGTLDESWAPAGRAYHEAAVADGASDVSLVEAPESGHFEMIAPWTSTWPLVLDALRRLAR